MRDVPEIEIPAEISATNHSAQAHYRKMIRDGQSKRFAVMCALQSPPGTKGTDKAFMEGRLAGQQLDQMPDRQAKYVVREAREAGINPSGKVYCSGIADKRAWRDPEAWVDSTADVLRVAKKRNLSVQGIVSHEAVQGPPLRKALSDSIVSEESKKALARHPKKSAGEIKEMVLDKFTPPWKKRNK